MNPQDEHLELLALNVGNENFFFYHGKLLSGE